MADLSSFTHKWRAAPAVSHQTETNKISKRNRQPVSCAPCRGRKLKCDRGHPCDACTKRNDQDSCVYGKSATTMASKREEPKANMKAQERLRHLEDLVKQMMEGGKDITTPQTPPVDDYHQPEGSLNKDIHGINYTGSTHWATVLDQIQELRNTLSPSNANDDDFQAVGGRADSLFSCPSPPPLHVILQRYLPSREDCNRYLSTYFNAKYMLVPFIHKHQFKRQYNRFWDNQLETSPIWISMLFSIFSVSNGIRYAPLSLFTEDNAPARGNDPFLIASAQCLVLANYARPQPQVIEALALYCHCKYTLVLDPSQELSLVFSIMARHCYTMGYHREPSVFKGQFTPFEGEMRRRTFSLLRQFDIMMSFQIGLPLMLQPESSDICQPSYLLDEDFDEDTVELPPPRPDTEPSQMLYMITKARLMETYGKVCQHTLSFRKQPVTATEIMDLDNAITQVIKSIPPIMLARPMSESYADPPNLTITRSNLLFVGEKARLVLHRKYMVTGPNADQSRQKCIDSSTRTIQHFLDLHAELQPGGQLFSDRWMMTSFTINDFLLALMVLCLAFSLGRKRYLDEGGMTDKWLEVDREARTLHQLLEKAQPVCEAYGAMSRESKHVAQAVALMLTKLSLKRNAAPLLERPTSTANLFDLNNLSLPSEDMPLNIMPLSIHNNDVRTDDLMSMQFSTQPAVAHPSSVIDFSGSSTGPDAGSNPTEPSPTSSWDMVNGPLSNILEGPEQIDWVQFDQFLWTTYGNQNMLEEDIY